MAGTTLSFLDPTLEPHLKKPVSLIAMCNAVQKVFCVMTLHYVAHQLIHCSLLYSL